VNLKLYTAALMQGIARERAKEKITALMPSHYRKKLGVDDNLPST